MAISIIRSLIVFTCIGSFKWRVVGGGRGGVVEDGTRNKTLSGRIKRCLLLELIGQKAVTTSVEGPAYPAT